MHQSVDANKYLCLSQYIMASFNSLETQGEGFEQLTYKGARRVWKTYF